ncbi:MAG: ABC transporter substrate-binding protein [Mailhella sp.]|nr:ABC transporter substrate-binding protein [Mailhella sp.]
MLRVFCLLLLMALPQTVWSAPQRIVALAPSAAELLLALDCGGRIVGRSGEIGPELASVPDIGSFHSPSLEKVLALAPDLCVGVGDGTPPVLLRRLKEAGVETMTLDVRSFEGLFHELARLGNVLGIPEKAEALVRSAGGRLERIKSSAGVGRKLPSVLFLVQEKPFMAAAQGTFISHIIEKAGAVCAVAVQGNAVYPVLGREELARLAPDVVLVSSMDSGRGLPPERIDGADLSPELASSRVYAVDADMFTRPSLRALDALDQLVNILRQEKR